MNATTALYAIILAGCGGVGTRPHDMSIRGHEEFARTEENAAALHERYTQGTARGPNPNPEVTLLSGGATCPPSEFAVCWGGGSSDAHTAEAEVHRKAAAAHRAASQALRDAERAGCVGIADDDRDMSPFEHREDVASVEMRPDGALVFFRAVPRLTEQRLQRVIDCHLARNAALGHAVPEMPACPLVPKGVSATVASTPTGLAVTLRSDDPTTVRDVQRRAQTLVK